MKVYDYQKYQRFTEIYQDIICDLIDNPQYCISPRGIPVREMINVTVVADPKDVHIDFTKTKAPERQPVYDKYKKEELEWYLSGCTLASSAPSKFWERLANDKGYITSNYGAMMLHEKVYPSKAPAISFATEPVEYKAKIIMTEGEMQTPFERVISTLSTDIDSRQAILHYNRPEHCFPSNKDFPCTVYSQVFVRDSKLHMTTSMRSCDCFLGLSYDICWSSHLMSMILDELNSKGMNLELGDLTMVFGSLHMYEKNLEICSRICLNAD